MEMRIMIFPRSEQIKDRIGALRLHPAITVPPKRILRVAGTRPLPFAARVGRDGGAASVRQPQNTDAIFPGLLGAGGIGQPQITGTIFLDFLVYLDAAIRLERHHVNERISVRQERRQAFNEVVEVSPNAPGVCRAVVALDDRRKNWRHSLLAPRTRTRVSATRSIMSPPMRLRNSSPFPLLDFFPAYGDTCFNCQLLDTSNNRVGLRRAGAAPPAIKSASLHAATHVRHVR